MQLSNADRVLVTSAVFTVASVPLRMLLGDEALDKLVPAIFMAYAGVITLWCACRRSSEGHRYGR